MQQRVVVYQHQVMQLVGYSHSSWLDVTTGNQFAAWHIARPNSTQDLL
jgi:hypothetical protein